MEHEFSAEWDLGELAERVWEEFRQRREKDRQPG